MRISKLFPDLFPDPFFLGGPETWGPGPRPGPGPVKRLPSSRYQAFKRIKILGAWGGAQSQHPKPLSSRGGSSHRLESRFVLGCIDTSDSESRRIFQHFSKSTRVSQLCTASFQIFASFCNFSLIFEHFSRILQKIVDFSANQAFFASSFTEFCRNCGKLRRIAGTS